MPAVSSPLRWQSRAVLLLTCPAAAVYGLIQFLDIPSPRVFIAALVASVLLAALVLAARAATPGAALVGLLLAFCYGVTPNDPHTPLWLLTLSLVLTLGASRLGRERKRAQGMAEGKHGRDAAQVAANVGVGALAGAAINSHGELLAHTALLAALAEATADTLASELGQLARTRPRMLLTGRPAEPGTDGAVSLPGTLAGVAGAGLLALAAHPVLALPWPYAVFGAGCGIAGLFFDSILGQLLERRALLNNDAVNFLSTLFSALLALSLGQLQRSN